MLKYLVIPARSAHDWSKVFAYLDEKIPVLSGNDLMGCRTYFASTGKLVIKLATG